MFLSKFRPPLVAGTALLIALLHGLSACGGGSEPASEAAQDDHEAGEGAGTGSLESLGTAARLASRMEDIQKDGEALANTVPADNESLKALLPDELDGLPRKKRSVGNAMGVELASVSAEYYEDDAPRRINISVTDGAGAAGSSFVTLMRITLTSNHEEETEGGYNKPFKLEGAKGRIEQNPGSEQGQSNSKIDLLVADRFILSVSGEQYDGKALADLIEEADLIHEIEELAS